MALVLPQERAAGGLFFPLPHHGAACKRARSCARTLSCTCTLMNLHSGTCALGRLCSRACTHLYSCSTRSHPRVLARLHNCTVQLRTHARVCSRACTAALKPLRSRALAVSKPSCSCTLVHRYHRALTHSCRCTPVHSPSLAHSGGALVHCTAVQPCHCTLAPPCTCTPTHACPRARRPPPPPLAHVRFGARRLLHAGACPPAVTWLAGRGLCAALPRRCGNRVGPLRACAVGRTALPASPELPPAPSTHPGSPRVFPRPVPFGLVPAPQSYLRLSCPQDPLRFPPPRPARVPPQTCPKSPPFPSSLPSFSPP
ncbi:protein diaphanous homolog 1-like [Aquila chrysaetos chrysaetos]|uniref:protein diaphanous homolog 1-like n=1 Tax=Aquila chrysaetos chrysaetos TaxID=223781 RepID=UPI0011769A0A|nr:protein diaphanous homolog 1-like [Aquila chrysaetos chrysaetos]